jgi:hypothetical protein
MISELIAKTAEWFTGPQPNQPQQPVAKEQVPQAAKVAVEALKPKEDPKPAAAASMPTAEVKPISTNNTPNPVNNNKPNTPSVVKTTNVVYITLKGRKK